MIDLVFVSTHALQNRFQTAPSAQGGKVNHQGNSNAGALSRMSGDATAARESQVPAAINRLQNALERLHHAADRLEQRAGVALRPSAPAVPANRIEKVGEPKAALAQAVDSLTERVDAACERVTDVTDRLEV